MINNKLIKAKCCPICNSKKKINIGKINSHIKKLENLFDLLKCLNCDHRYLSKLPKDPLVVLPNLIEFPHLP